MRDIRRLLALTTVVGAACTLNVVGCGGSNSTGGGSAPDAGGDGSMSADSSMMSEGGSMSDDGSMGDSSMTDGSMSADSSMTDGSQGDSSMGADSSMAADSGTDSSMAANDSGADAGPPPCTDGTACSVGAANGICAGGVCATCDSGGTSAGPDATCTTAYGGGATPYVCSAGSCVAGNCNSSADCAAPNGTCGFSTPNVCGGCTNDSQCPSSNICVTTAGGTQGTCVAATTGCSGITANDVTCSLNASDECCAGSCVAGNCCLPDLTSHCGVGVACAKETPSETTGGGICTTCAAVTGTNPTYVVDPINGNDASGTGNNSAASACAFQTITRALQVIGATAPANTTIQVVNKAGTGTVSVTGVAAGSPGTGQEKFPIVLPSNVTLTSSGGAVTIEVPARSGTTLTAGVVLSGNPSAVTGGSAAPLTIDGQSKAATFGVLVQSAGATLSNVAVTNFGNDGIVVSNIRGSGTASALTVNAGVQATGNATDGLAVTGASSATINGDVPQIMFNTNGAHGIVVMGSAHITASGTVNAGSPATLSSVIASGNGAAGIWIQQTGNSPPLNSLSGVVCTASTAGNGLRITPGSNVKVRNSWFLGNSSGSGIDIEAAARGTGVSTAIGGIDLGTNADPGHNVVQAPSGGSVDQGAGICLIIPATANEQLAAEGNIFGGNAGTAVDCSAGGPTLLRVAGNLGCTGHSDVGGTIVAFPASDAGTGNTINVNATHCTY